MEHIPNVPSKIRRVSRESDDGTFRNPSMPHDNDEARVDFRAYLTIIRRRKWLIIAPFCIAFPIVCIVFLLKKPLYGATVTLLMDPEKSKIVNIEDILPHDKSKEYYETQISLISSPIIVEGVINTLKEQKPDLIFQEFDNNHSNIINIMKEIPRTIKKKIQEKLHGHEYSLDPEEIIRRETIIQLRKSIKVEVIDGTRLLDITVYDSNPHDVVTKANTLADVYIKHNVEKKVEAYNKASDWLSREILELKDKLQAAELALQDFFERRGLMPYDLDEKLKNTSDLSGELSTAYTVTKARGIELQAQLDEMKTLLKRSTEQCQFSSSVLNAPILLDLQQKCIALEGELASRSQVFKDKHPKILEIIGKIEQLRNSINIEIRKNINSTISEYNVNIAKEKKYESIINQKKLSSFNIEKYMPEYLNLKRDAESKRDLYTNLLKRLDETEVTKNLQFNDIKIVKRAEVPLRPVSSNIMVKIVMCTIITLVLGIGSAFIVESFEKRITSVEEAERYLHLPVIGVVYRYKEENKINKDNEYILHNNYSSSSNFYSNIKTMIDIQMINKKEHGLSLLITSALPREGKSVIASNLAISFAQSNKMVVLVDINLHKPSLHMHFNLTNKYGLTDVLIDDYSWDKLIQKTPIDNLKILTSGPIPNNPSELLDLARLSKFHQSLTDAFDIVIYDAPLVLAIPDTVAIASAMHGVLLVHNPTLGNKESIIASKKILTKAHANIIGIIINNADERYFSTYRDISSLTNI